MKLLILTLIILISSNAFCQTKTCKISHKVQSQQNALLENATVELLRAKDSSMVTTAISDKAGLAEFERLFPGTGV